MWEKALNSVFERIQYDFTIQYEKCIVSYNKYTAVSGNLMINLSYRATVFIIIS